MAKAAADHRPNAHPGDMPNIYRATPACSRGCSRCLIACAVAVRARDDILKELALAEKAVLEFMPSASFSRH
uniref:hypothetical protein n=1 Tax=Edaphosphingomonas laterariae TaxID=861865 RepID=UPI001181A3FA|nr:hypothetical protein [Sphingomonas laterariae]